MAVKGGTGPSANAVLGALWAASIALALLFAYDQLLNDTRLGAAAWEALRRLGR